MIHNKITNSNDHNNKLDQNKPITTIIIIFIIFVKKMIQIVLNLEFIRNFRGRRRLAASRANRSMRMNFRKFSFARTA